jgi:hypothetical protein
MATILSRSGEKQQPHSQKKLKKLCYYSCLHIAQSNPLKAMEILKKGASKQ